MKTLNEAVQIAIISEAGSTYRNFILCTIKDGAPYEQSFSKASKLVQEFIDLMSKNLKAAT